MSATVDGTIWSGGTVPLGGGPKVEVHQKNTKGIKWGDGGDFVLAFRVKRFKVSKRSGIKDGDYTRGSMLGHDPKEIEQEHVVVVLEDEDEFEIESLDPDWEGVRVSEGDEDIIVVVPRVDKPEN